MGKFLHIHFPCSGEWNQVKSIRVSGLGGEVASIEVGKDSCIVFNQFLNEPAPYIQVSTADNSVVYSAITSFTHDSETQIHGVHFGEYTSTDDTNLNLFNCFRLPRIEELSTMIEWKEKNVAN